jgi:hypothetical protein
MRAIKILSNEPQSLAAQSAVASTICLGLFLNQGRDLKYGLGFAAGMRCLGVNEP